MSPAAPRLGECTKIGRSAAWTQVSRGHPVVLQGFEQVRKIHVDSEPFSVDNGLTTPTFKHKRPQLLEHYKSEIDR